MNVNVKLVVVLFALVCFTAAESCKFTIQNSNGKYYRYDLSELSHPSGVADFLNITDSEGNNITLNICGASSGKCAYGTAVCMHVADDDSYVSLGEDWAPSYDEDDNVDPDKGFKLTYNFGDDCGTDGSYETEISLVCDEKEKGVIDAVEKVDCTYKLRIRSKYACGNEVPVYHYELPKLPCEWTYKSVEGDMDEVWDKYMTYYVNGKFLKIDYSEGGDPFIALFRYDLADPGYVKHFSTDGEEETMDFEEVKDYFKPRTFDNDEYIHDYFNKEDSYYFGKKCTKYYDEDPDDCSLFVGDDGFPIGLLNCHKDVTNITFTFGKTPLSLFTLKKEAGVQFKDERVYTAPKKSTCSDGSGSSGSSTVFISKFIIIAASAIFFMAH